jgi:hypothetical protein
MDTDAQGFVDGLKGCFADLKDPRNEKSCEHLLFDIVAIAVLSVACGADDWCAMATFAHVKLDWLKTFLALPGGAPSHDTFRRVFGLLRVPPRLLLKYPLRNKVSGPGRGPVRTGRTG